MLRFRVPVTIVRTPLTVLVVAAMILGVIDQASGKPRAPQLSMRMFKDPEFSFERPPPNFPKGLVKLWTEALQQDEADLKQQAAISIASAHQEGLTDWEAAKPALLTNLEDPVRAVRLASATAIIQLDMRDAAGALAKAADEDGLEMHQIVEPALARWRYEPRFAQWIDWLAPPLERQSRARIAMRALAAVKSSQAEFALLQIAENDSRSSLRMAAGRALGDCVTEALETRAGALAFTPTRQRGSVSRIVAARMLASHTSSEAKEMLGKLITDMEPAVASAALETLSVLDPDQVIAEADHIVQHGDSNSRRFLVDALASRPNDAVLVRLADLLDDRNPTVRVAARLKLIEFVDQEQWREIVRRESRRVLAANSWRGLEQAVHLVDRLDDKEVEDRLIELLDHDRPEVYVTSAWSLHRMNPQTRLKEALEYAERRWEEGRPDESAHEMQMMYLMQWFGISKYKPAEPFMRRRIPKSFYLAGVRNAAIWALGHIHEGKPNDELIGLLKARVEDTQSNPPELDDVRMYCVVAIGRMKAKGEIEFLRKWLKTESPVNPVGAACAWALNQITGEPIPEVKRYPGVRSGFFLERRSK